MLNDELGYHSPISLIASEIETQMEGDTIQAIQKFGIDIDKEELLKALSYDRHQYEKGYGDARKEFERKQSEWVFDRDIDSVTYGWFVCSLCNYVGATVWDFCPHCGASMKPSNPEGDKEERCE